MHYVPCCVMILFFSCVMVCMWERRRIMGAIINTPCATFLLARLLTTLPKFPHFPRSFFPFLGSSCGVCSWTTLPYHYDTLFTHRVFIVVKIVIAYAHWKECMHIRWLSIYLLSFYVFIIWKYLCIKFFFIFFFNFIY